MWKYRVSFRNMINVTFVTGRRGRERKNEGERAREGGGRHTKTVYSCLCTCLFITIYTVYNKNKLKNPSGQLHSAYVFMTYWCKCVCCGELSQQTVKIRKEEGTDLIIYRWKYIFYFSFILIPSARTEKDVPPHRSTPPPPQPTHFQPKTNIQAGTERRSVWRLKCVSWRGWMEFIWLQSISFFPCCSLPLFLSFSPSLLTYLFLRKITYKPSVKGFMVY